MTDASSGPSGESPFWRFSLRFYARPGVAPACLVLQDEGGVDVNLMLFLLFLAEGGTTVSRTEMARLDAAIAAWRKDVVAPLRAIRRGLKTGVGEVPQAAGEPLRALVKKVELESERIEQSVLERLAPGAGRGGTPRTEAARANLAAYEAHLGGLPEKPLQIVLDAFTDTPPWPRES